MNPWGRHSRAASSGGLAAAICMAVAQVVFLAVGRGAVGALAIGASLSSIAFGGTYAATYFVLRARHGRGPAPAAVPAPPQP